MTRFSVKFETTTGAVHTIDCNSATEALATEDGLYEQGYTGVEIIPLP